MWRTCFPPQSGLFGEKRKTHKEGGHSTEGRSVLRRFMTHTPDKLFSNCSSLLSRPLLSGLRNKWARSRLARCRARLGSHLPRFAQGPLENRNTEEQGRLGGSQVRRGHYGPFSGSQSLSSRPLTDGNSSSI